MAKKKKHYTEEFKREAVRLLVTRGAQSVAEIAKRNQFLAQDTSVRAPPPRRSAWSRILGMVPRGNT